MKLKNRARREMPCVTRLIGCALFLFLPACTSSSVEADLPHPSAPPSMLIHPVPVADREERVIVAFGDSLTAGLGVSRKESYPSQLQERLTKAGYRYRVVNAGVSGDTTAGGLRRLDWVLKNKPGIVILELGANDGLRGLDLKQTRANFVLIIEGLQKSGAHVVLAGMKLPPNYGEAYTRAFSEMYADLATRYRVVLIPFFLEGVALDPELNQEDGIHPTGKGYRIVVDRLWSVLEPLLEK